MVLLLVAVAATFTCFYPTLDNDFVNWDDQTYVVRNWLVKDVNLEYIKEIIKTPQIVGTYQPVTIISLAIDYKIGNGNPFPFHVTNLVLHLLCMAILFWWMKLLTKRVEIAFICALLFGIHPMHVEPVAWVSSRKDVLYAFFFFAALVSYMFYLTKKWKGVTYSLTLLLFFLSLMSKSVAVVLPIVLLLTDYFLERKDYRRMLLEKVPFFLLSLGVGLIAIRGQQEGSAMMDFEVYPFSKTIFVGFYGLVWYLVSFLVPYKLAALHPYPFDHITNIQWYFYASSVPVLILIILSVIYGRKNKHYIFGMGFFLLSIASLLKILPYGRGVVAERYTYIPYIGLFYLLAWIFIKFKDGDWKVPKWAKKILLVVSIVWVGTLGIITFVRADVWQNGGTMWLDVTEKHPDHYYAYSCAGDYFFLQGEYERAFELMNKSIQLYDSFSDVYNNRGKVYEKLGWPDLAFADYNRAVDLDKANFGAYLNRAILKVNLYKDTEGAWQDINQAITLKPDYCIAYVNRGVFYEQKGEFDKAEEDYTMAIKLEPNNAKHYRYRGLLKYYTDRKEEALKDYNEALRYDPNYGNVYYLRSRIYKDQGNIEQARLDARKALELGFKVKQEYLESLGL